MNKKQKLSKAISRIGSRTDKKKLSEATNGCIFLLIFIVTMLLFIGFIAADHLSAALFVLSVPASLIWILALVDCAFQESNKGNDKIVWILIIIFTSIIGALLYLMFRRPQRLKELGK